MKALAALALAAAPAAAWASFNRGGLEHVLMLVFLWALYLWGGVLAAAAAAGAFRHRALVWIATGCTAALALFGALTWDDPRLLGTRPLPWAGVTAALTLLLVPLGLAAPFLANTWSRLGSALLLGGLLLAAPVAGIGWEAWHGLHVSRVIERTDRLAPGQLQAHVLNVPRTAQEPPLQPWLWTEASERKYTSWGLRRLAFVTGPQPLSASDTQALATVVGWCPPSGACELDVDVLEGKLAWDAWLAATPDERARLATAMSPRQAEGFLQHFATPHVAHLCPTLDAVSTRALWQLAGKPPTLSGERLRRAVRERCGRR